MFRVGAKKYVVRIPKQPITYNGRSCLGLCVESAEEILLCPTLETGARLRVLFHELAHAFIYAYGLPDTAEKVCDFFASMMEVAIKDLDTGGGIEALNRLEAGESFGMETAKIALTRHRYCPVCNGTIAGGSVGCRKEGSGLLRMQIECDHCGVKAVWRETATIGGLPSGNVVGEPSIGSAITD